jgi:hypothetical protein
MNLAYLGDALDHWKGSLFEPTAARTRLARSRGRCYGNRLVCVEAGGRGPFLDPDTGVATGKVEKISQYVMPYEIDRRRSIHSRVSIAASRRR